MLESTITFTEAGSRASFELLNNGGLLSGAVRLLSGRASPSVRPNDTSEALHWHLYTHLHIVVSHTFVNHGLTAHSARIRGWCCCLRHRWDGSPTVAVAHSAAQHRAVLFTGPRCNSKAVEGCTLWPLSSFVCPSIV